jgi:D-inositol-3-phosphate glycosyltransferase
MEEKQARKPGLVLGLPMDGPPVSYSRETNAERMIFGQSVATQDMASALLRHGSAESYVFLVEPQDLGAWVGSGRSHPKARVELEADILRQGIERLGLTLWHDIRGNPAAPSFKIRTGFAPRKPYPITRTIHCLSPQPYIGTLVLPLLTESVLPCDSVICTSRASRDALRNLLDGVAATFNRRHGADLSYQGRLDVLPLAIDIDFFRPLPQAQCRRKLGLPEDAFVLLWFGRLAAADKADLLVLLRVVERLRRKNPLRKLLLVLAGSQRPELPSAPGLRQYAQELGIAEQVLVQEAFPPSERNVLYSAADVFVAPTDNVQETFGLTPLEAMACGVPQVVADWDGYRDTVEHGVTGFLVPTYWADCDEDISNVSLTNLDVMVEHFKLGQSVVVDLEGYEHHLQTLLDQPALRAGMAAASRRRAVEAFGWGPVIRRYEALWTELAELAQGLEPPDLTHSHSRQRYFDVFRGYASHIVPGSAPIYLTLEGRRLLAGTHPIPSQYGGLEHLFFDLPLLRRLLALLGGPSPTAPTLDLLVGALCREDDGAVPGARDRARRHVLWLLKHGFASLNDPGAAR